MSNDIPKAQKTNLKARGRARGKLLIVSAPSGSGKTTLCKKICARHKDIFWSVSVTTRDPRRGERKGADYNFVSREEFVKMRLGGELLEWEENFGNFYGTPRLPIERELARGRHALLTIDVKGAMNVKRLCPRESVLIFIKPPSMKILRARLESRLSEGKDAIQRRLSVAGEELAREKDYDYTVVNDSLDAAYNELEKIVRAETDKPPKRGDKKERRKG